VCAGALASARGEQASPDYLPRQTTCLSWHPWHADPHKQSMGGREREKDWKGGGMRACRRGLYALRRALGARGTILGMGTCGQPRRGHLHVGIGMCSWACAQRACRSLLTCVTTSMRAACLGAWCVGVGMCGTGGFRQLQSAPCRLSHRQCRDAVGHCVLGGWRAVRRVALRRFACLCPQYPGQPPRPRLGQLVSSSPSDLVPY